MPKTLDQNEVNLYYMKNEQGVENNSTLASDYKKRSVKKRKKKKEDKKENIEDKFDIDTEVVIGMADKNKLEEKRKKEDKEKKKKKKRKLNKRGRIIVFCIKWITIIGIIAGGVVFALTSPMFNIKEISVINNNQISSEQIVSLSQIQLETNIFKINKSQVIENIKQNAYVESVEITRRLPNKIQISIKERTRKFNIRYLNHYAYINSQGYILEIADEKVDLPIIEGIKTTEEEIEPGKRLCVEDLEKLEVALRIVSTCTDCNIADKITSINIANENEYSIYMEEEKKTIYLGDASNLSNRILYVQMILEEEKDKEGEFFVNGDLNNGFQPYFREKL